MHEYEVYFKNMNCHLKILVKCLKYLLTTKVDREKQLER